ncbi:hypothetical protein FO519_000192 [Halicephalobus sp. NKZ332]|nr:hypothetical protein FO519_000192 [Halicephalobus sp. NKZ332]
MELPSPWLTFAILVHGVLGSYVEMLSLIISRLTTPLNHFYNESLTLHYGISLDERGVSEVMSLVGNVTLIGSIFSTIFLLPKMDNWGRKYISVYLTGFTSMIASILIVISKHIVSVESFFVAQFFIGAVTPFRNGVVKLYIAECSPDSIRGFGTQSVTALAALMTLVSTLLSLEQVFGTDDRWQNIGLISLCMCIFFVIFGSLIPESPKYLCFKNFPKEKTTNSIKTFHGKNSDVQKILEDYSCEFHLTKSTSMSFKELWSDPTLRDSIFLIFISAMVHSFSSYQILSLNNLPLKMRYGFTNSDALLLDTVLGFSSLPFVVLLPYLLEKVGRRKLFLAAMVLNVFSSFLMFFAQVFFITVGPGMITRSIAIFFSLTNLVAIFLGTGFMGIILIADLLPPSGKVAATQTLLLSTNFVSMGVNFGFATLEPFFGAFIHVPFVIGQGFFLHYCYYNLPETKGLAVYENFEQIRSPQGSGRHSLVGESRNQSFSSYGSV